MQGSRDWILGCVFGLSMACGKPAAPANEPTSDEGPPEAPPAAAEQHSAHSAHSARDEACLQAWRANAGERHWLLSRETLVRASTPGRMRADATALDEHAAALAPMRAEPFVSLAQATTDLVAALNDTADAVASRDVEAYAAARDRVDSLRARRMELLSQVVLECKASSWAPEQHRIEADGGRLPKADIQRTVRDGFGALRDCYTDGLARAPKLQGKIFSRFVIERDGSVGTVTISNRLVPNGPEEEADLAFLEQANGGLPSFQNDQTTMPDDVVSLCVGKAYYGLRFPPPEGGEVAVVYPISFAPE